MCAYVRPQKKYGESPLHVISLAGRKPLDEIQVAFLQKHVNFIRASKLPSIYRFSRP